MGGLKWDVWPKEGLGYWRAEAIVVGPLGPGSVGETWQGPR